MLHLGLKFMESDTTTIETSASTMNTRLPWYTQTIWVIALLLLLLFFPIGILLMWKYTHWHKYVKIGVTGLFLFLIFSSTFSDHKQENEPVATQFIVPTVAPDNVQPTPIVENISATESVTLLSTSSPSLTPSTTTYAVVSVTDGDTFKVSNNGKIETVRIVGINTSETVDPEKSIECFGKEASNKLKALLVGKNVQLEADNTQSDRDKYGRLLRFVTLEGSDVGLQMIGQGYAYESLYSSTPHKMRDTYVQAQQQAQANKVGLWADSACPVEVKKTATAIPKIAVEPSTTPTISTGGRSCSGPDLDCSDFSSQSEAQAFFNSCGWSAENDPMKLDSVGIGDGIPCESSP